MADRLPQRVGFCCYSWGVPRPQSKILNRFHFLALNSRLEPGWAEGSRWPRPHSRAARSPGSLPQVAATTMGALPGAWAHEHHLLWTRVLSDPGLPQPALPGGPAHTSPRRTGGWRASGWILDAGRGARLHSAPRLALSVLSLASPRRDYRAL